MRTHCQCATAVGGSGGPSARKGKQQHESVWVDKGTVWNWSKRGLVQIPSYCAQLACERMILSQCSAPVVLVLIRYTPPAQLFTLCLMRLHHSTNNSIRNIGIPHRDIDDMINSSHTTQDFAVNRACSRNKNLYR